MVPEMILIKDVEGADFSEPVCFVEAVSQSLRCAMCENVSPTMKEDSHGHMYCISCINMIEEEGKFVCENDGNVERISEMRQSTSAWDQVLQLVVKCPKHKFGCKFQASVEEILLHYQTCQEDSRKPCAFCGELIESKEHAAHITASCPKRPVTCPFCKNDIEECNLVDHLDDCDCRPANCTYCGRPFDTFKELRDVHLMECPRMPIDCPYKHLGCDYKGPRQEILTHTQNSTHIEILLERLNVMDEALQEARRENAKLEQRVRELEDRQSEADQYSVDMRDSIDVNKHDLEILKGDVQRLSQEPVTRRREEELGERLETFLGPFEHLLNGLRDVDQA
ncbi:TNF receptor-associated factor 5 isoform X2 [Ixodes scapularis]|uniref:TNF receptor-associated factor 5 isoform X2 n=1 Tax=Ixodes scapularis TaxID=6945 RepID=UPI001A9FC3D3|nr:TNF receptor-associated factor 5 isoform X2 [Ixodes scapularis]